MKVAFTSTDGETIDLHFGMTRNFHVWEVGPEEAKFVAQVPVPGGGDEEDRIAALAGALAECAIVYTLQIGGPAAARLIARRIHPMKTGNEVPVSDAVGRLQEILKGNPPPWLRKAMNRGNQPAFLEEG
ncbi:MAG: nitrogen fixation protein NifX [Deltaproteobacteria bacterium]|nr:MAG: nitrogen fixation protein NifX [Deltaproteobacteria bacterium]